jgi:hypothetical protein
VNLGVLSFADRDSVRHERLAQDYLFPLLFKDRSCLDPAHFGKPPSGAWIK